MMSNTVKCDICGKEMVPADVHSGDGVEDLCFECYHDSYDMDDEVVEDE
ncbi:hypothetical protein [Enterobacter cloacae]|nr:hypothetical protein [Enterobacter cloacae]MDK9961783.1 hypothetical protein [Enterobacter cloacae]